jgi:tRNA 2-thiouridine synthesizing protein B
MLHIVNKSHTHTSALASCLRLALPGSALLLTEDAIYAATATAAASSGIVGATAKLRVFALLPDVEARGMAGKLAEGIATVDYGGFVDLVAEHSTNQTWL